MFFFLFTFGHIAENIAFANIMRHYVLRMPEWTAARLRFRMARCYVVVMMIANAWKKNKKQTIKIYIELLNSGAQLNEGAQLWWSIAIAHYTALDAMQYACQKRGCNGF